MEWDEQVALTLKGMLRKPDGSRERGHVGS